jgi:hypothetical protein
MPLVINELILEVENTQPVADFAEYGLPGEEPLQKLMRDLEVAEERSKRLQLD